MTKTKQTIRTVGDARDEKNLAWERKFGAKWAREDAEAAAAKEQQARDEATLQANPEIGVLMREGRRMFYVNFPYRESSDAQALAASLAKGDA